MLDPRQELAGAVELSGARADRRRGHVVARRAELADPARVEQKLGTLDQGERLVVFFRHLQQHGVDEEQQVLGERRDVRKLERLLELRPRAGAVAQLEQRLAQTHARERLAPHRAHARD